MDCSLPGQAHAKSLHNLLPVVKTGNVANILFVVWVASSTIIFFI